MSCSSCFETIFKGNKFCPLCGSKAVESNIHADKKAGDCPRCKKKMQLIGVEGVELSECEKCEGVWTDVETFETICANRENQSAVLKKFDEILQRPKPVKVQYIPCPTCSQLMNRSNFAKVSGVIIDTCKGHGVWFDAEELPRIIEFIRKGGMEYSRQKEKAHLDDQKQKLRAEKFKLSVDRFKNEGVSKYPSTNSTRAIKEFIDFIID